MDDRDKIIAFLARLLARVIYDEYIDLNDRRALDNIIDYLPEVSSKDLRW